MAGADGFHGLRVSGLPILDVLGFVEHQRVELQIAIPIRVAPDERVAGDYEVAAGDILEVLVPLGAM